MDTLHGTSEINYSVPLVTPTDKSSRKNGNGGRPLRPKNSSASNLATGSTSIETAEQVLVDPETGVTARIHSPVSASISTGGSVMMSAPPFRCNYIQRQWMRAGQAIGLLTPMAIAIALVTPVYLIAVGVIDTLELPALTAKYTIITCVGVWMTVTVGVSTLVAPFLSPTFGYRIRRSVLPINSMPDSMHRLFLEMRSIIGVFLLCQIAAATAGYFCLGNEAPLQLWTRWQPVLFGSACFMGLGVALLTFGHQAFLQTRGRKIRRWLSQCWRGVALRSFIPAWDNQRRPIFESCRASRRLAEAYRSIKLGAAGCFAAAGCLAAMSVGDSIVGIVFLVASLVATASVWPTANRIVDWTKTVVDPITGDIDED